MNNTHDQNTIQFLGNLLQTQQVNLKIFIEQQDQFKFDANHQHVWQFIVLKALEPNFSFLLPLSNYLLDNQLCPIDYTIANYAGLQGALVEKQLKSLKNIATDLNSNMASFHFEEKIVITNEPMENIFNICKKIINNTNDIDFLKVQESISNVKINPNEIDLLKERFSKNNKPKIKP